MLDVSAGVLTFVGFALILLGVLSGFPVAWVLGGIGVITGFLFWGPEAFATFYHQMYGLASNYILLAIPLFIFMAQAFEQLRRPTAFMIPVALLCLILFLLPAVASMSAYLAHEVAQTYMAQRAAHAALQRVNRELAYFTPLTDKS